MERPNDRHLNFSDTTHLKAPITHLVEVKHSRVESVYTMRGVAW